ncbi:uncharacterized protein E0L32_002783 [Thyridium curvatum]|uniref:Uncharacterized protein n=1 Tax=Thyridium curvatum TaxID=1093900 RepID=A0A507BHR6_9PEZI|nr:uncharacterized protein E0L32_002783 [Thyridium curvatum]TPX18274.1 hypothetical protein E0L32_002783 [Thyridium curvatum]
MTVPRRCQGDVTFNEIYRNAFSEWPRHIPGYICKTPPVGRGSAPRFAQCCSGPLYNITHITGPSDPAFPVSCAAFCQVDPKMDETNSRYPFGWSEHFMCLTNGGEEPSEWEVVCGSVSVSGMPFPTSYESTIKGPWQTKSYYRPSDSPDWVTFRNSEEHGRNHERLGQPDIEVGAEQCRFVTNKSQDHKQRWRVIPERSHRSFNNDGDAKCRGQRPQVIGLHRPCSSLWADIIHLHVSLIKSALDSNRSDSENTSFTSLASIDSYCNNQRLYFDLHSTGGM